MVVIVTLQGSVGKEAVVGGEGGGTMKGRVCVCVCGGGGVKDRRVNSERGPRKVVK